MYELINPHKTTTDSHYQFIVHNLRINLLSSEHVETAAESGDRQLHTCLVDVLSQHLIDNITLNRPVSYLRGISGPYLLHLRHMQRQCFVSTAQILSQLDDSALFGPYFSHHRVKLSIK